MMHRDPIVFFHNTSHSLQEHFPGGFSPPVAGLWHVSIPGFCGTLSEMERHHAMRKKSMVFFNIA